MKYLFNFYLLLNLSIEIKPYIIPLHPQVIKLTLDNLIEEYKTKINNSLEFSTLKTSKWINPESEENIKFFYSDITFLGKNYSLGLEFENNNNNNYNNNNGDIKFKPLGKKNSWKEVHRKRIIMSNEDMFDVDLLIAKDLIIQLKEYLFNTTLSTTTIKKKKRHDSNNNNNIINKKKDGDSFYELIKTFYGSRCKPPFPFPFNTSDNSAELDYYYFLLII